jgi:hypothetical protein
MKKITLIFVLLAFTISSFAQQKKDETDVFFSTFGVHKKDVVAKFVHPTDAQKEAFWKLYDEYEAKRKEIGKTRLDLFQEYSANYTTMTNEQAGAWMGKIMEVQTTTDKLVAEYYEKIKSVTSSTVAVQFYQIEYYILNRIRIEIFEQIPFIPEQKR